MNQKKTDMKPNLELVINIREERMRNAKKPQQPEKKCMVNEVITNAKAHFEEIFNRI